MSTRWLDGLPTETRGSVLAAMRAIRARCDRALHEHETLRPPAGKLAAGGAHMDPFFQGEALAAFLSALSKGMTPDSAANAAQLARVRAICAWNASRADYQVHRSVESESGLIDRAREDILRAIVEADAAHVASAA